MTPRLKITTAAYALFIALLTTLSCIAINTHGSPIHAGNFPVAWSYPLDSAEIPAGYHILYDKGSVRNNSPFKPVPHEVNCVQGERHGVQKWLCNHTLTDLDDCTEYHVSVKALDADAVLNPDWPTNPDGSNDIIRGFADPTITAVNVGEILGTNFTTNTYLSDAPDGAPLPGPAISVACTRIQVAGALPQTFYVIVPQVDGFVGSYAAEFTPPEFKPVEEVWRFKVMIEADVIVEPIPPSSVDPAGTPE
jgi:hypothetical protein